MQYIRLSEGLNNYQLLPANNDIWQYIKDPDNKDYYQSIYRYEQEHYDKWKETKSLSGIKNVKTDKLVFDFDDVDNPENAKNDTITLINKLLELGMPENTIDVAFSGNKGFSVEIITDKQFSPDELKTLALSLTEGLKTRDTSIYDPQRIFRIAGTKHLKSGLYKQPLTINELKTLDMSKIREMAKEYKDKNIQIYPAKLKEDIYKKRIKEQTKVETAELGSLDMTKKPRFLDSARWYLQNGYFSSGERSNALICLAATYKNLGFTKDHTYRLLKGVAEIQSQRNNVERFADKEIWNNIIQQVYGDNWLGGQFSLKDENSWLYQYAKKMNLSVKDGDKPLILSDLGGDSFVRYAKSFNENRITTGLTSLDKAFPITAGSNVAIVGASASGKTSLCLNILKESNKQNVVSVFASLDMSKSRLFEKMLYNVTKGTKSREFLFNEYLNGNGDKYDKMVKDAYPNTYLFAKSSPTITELKEYIEQVQEHTGKPVRLLMIDYFERIGSDRSDDTAASKDVASGIQDLIADFPELTPITLYQPNKFSLGGGPDAPILSYTNIKGSSFIYQSARQILSLWRPFYIPSMKDDDKFMEMAILKNDLGELGHFKFKWEGRSGSISELEDGDEMEYKELMNKKTGDKGSSEDAF